jgi:chromosome segregation ATPase
MSNRTDGLGDTIARGYSEKDMPAPKSGPTAALQRERDEAGNALSDLNSRMIDERARAEKAEARVRKLEAKLIEATADGGFYLTHTLEEIATANARAEHAEAAEKAMREALQALVDEQNGPPLIRDAAEWEAAMSKARAALQGQGGNSVQYD